MIVHDKVKETDGGIIEIKIWSVPASEAKRHGFRYPLAYVRGSRLLVCYDNHAGKGDHRHREGRVESYRFTTISKLLEDFYRDVRRAKKHES